MAKLQRETRTVVRELDRADGEYFLSVRENPLAVLMSLSRYEALRSLEERFRHEEDEMLRVVQEGDREYKNRETIRARSLKELRSKV